MRELDMFRDIKNQLDNPDIIKIISYSEYECSLERAALKAQSYRNNEAQQLYGWVENGNILGICAFLIHQNKVEITTISVTENARHRGIGRAMISALWKEYEMAVEAETDDDAVEFYRKCGFETTAIQKNNVRRWMCVLPAQKTLYISDLDGTLLNRNAELSKYTITTLNKLIAKGIHFSVATARTAATSVFILERVAINMPVILMNGVLAYDTQTKKYIKKELLEQIKIEQILSAMGKTNLTGFMYALSGDELITYYERLDNDALKTFVDERMRKYNKKFTQIDNFAYADADVIYFCFIDTSYNIHRLHKEIKNIGGIRIEMYQDIYSDDLWCLEIFNETASKYSAVQFLRQRQGFDRIVGFGDNLNDLPLFAACDECYAVANAKPEVKEKATAVIDSNDNDGVTKWLEENTKAGKYLEDY